MAGEWRDAKIEEVADRVAMGPFGSSIKVETFVPSGVPIISGQHLHGSKVDDRVGFNFVTEAHADRLKNANVQRGDVIFTHAGNIGQAAYIPESSLFERYVISQRQFYMRCNREKILPEFVVAYFKTPEGQHQLLANTSQVGVPSIAQPVTYLRTIEIPLPPLPEQRAIAHILGTLGRQDRTEPADERNAGSDGARALQIVVRGLRSRPRQGRRPRSRPPQTHRRPLPCPPRRLRTRRDSGGMEDRVCRRRIRLDDGHKNGSQSYTYQFMRGLEDVFARFEAEGTVFGSISKKDFHALPCVAPPSNVVDVFEKLLTPLDDVIENADNESRTLAALRDTLLPKVISGELRVEDATRLAEATL